MPRPYFPKSEQSVLGQQVYSGSSCRGHLPRIEDSEVFYHGGAVLSTKLTHHRISEISDNSPSEPSAPSPPSGVSLKAPDAGTGFRRRRGIGPSRRPATSLGRIPRRTPQEPREGPAREQGARRGFPEAVQLSSPFRLRSTRAWRIPSPTNTQKLLMDEFREPSNPGAGLPAPGSSKGERLYYYVDEREFGRTD